MLILEQVSMTVKVAVAVSPCGAVAGTGAHCVRLMTASRFYGLGTFGFSMACNSARQPS